jgi:hypothetical protein
MPLIHLTTFLWICRAFFAGNSRQNGERRDITRRRMGVASMKTHDSFFPNFTENHHRNFIKGILIFQKTALKLIQLAFKLYDTQTILYRKLS